MAIVCAHLHADSRSGGHQLCKLLFLRVRSPAGVVKAVRFSPFFWVVLVRSCLYARQSRIFLVKKRRRKKALTTHESRRRRRRGVSYIHELVPINCRVTEASENNTTASMSVCVISLRFSRIGIGQCKETARKRPNK